MGGMHVLSTDLVAVVSPAAPVPQGVPWRAVALFCETWRGPAPESTPGKESYVSAFQASNCSALISSAELPCWHVCHHGCVTVSNPVVLSCGSRAREHVRDIWVTGNTAKSPI